MEVELGITGFQLEDFFQKKNLVKFFLLGCCPIHFFDFLNIYNPRVICR